MKRDMKLTKKSKGSKCEVRVHERYQNTNTLEIKMIQTHKNNIRDIIFLKELEHGRKTDKTLNAKRQRNKGNQKGIYRGRPEST